jgi:arylsulfatase A-like enzyme
MPAGQVGSTAAAMLSRVDADQPVFFYLHTMEPHMPYAPDPGTLARFDRQPNFEREHGRSRLADREVPSRIELDHLVDRYDAEIADVDAAFDDFLDMLRGQGRFENSLIILLADHGEAFGEHGVYNHGNTLCAEEMRVPLVIRFPQGRYGGGRIMEIVSLIDIFPTVLAAAGIGSPGCHRVAGSDLRAVAGGPRASGSRPVFAEASMHGPTKCDLVAVIDADGYKRVLDMSVGKGGGRGPRWAGLWDTGSDPEERVDLTSSHPARAAYLEQLIASWLLEQIRLRDELGISPAADQGELPEELRRDLEALGYLD